MRQTSIMVIIVFVLIIGNIFFGVQYISLKKELRETKAALSTESIQKKLEFAKLFIQEVLKSESEVDFETRLKLENAVRELEDEEILAQWKKFTESSTEQEAQDGVKELLDTLVGKCLIE